jgi:hypothetical protein
VRILLTDEQVRPVVRLLLATFNPTLSTAVVDDGGAAAMLLGPATPRSRILPAVSTAPVAICARPASTLSGANVLGGTGFTPDACVKVATVLGPAKQAAGPGWLIASPTVAVPKFVSTCWALNTNRPWERLISAPIVPTQQAAAPAMLTLFALDPEVPSLMGKACGVEVSFGYTTVVLAVALIVEFACEVAVTVNVFTPMPGKLAGAVYSPPALIVPAAAFPPGTPFTLQLTGVPVPEAVYSCVLLSTKVAVAGVTLSVGAAATVRLAEAVFPIPPLIEETAPVVLVKVPAPVAVTLTTKEQLPVVAAEPPVSVMLVVPAAAVAVPPQVEVSPLGVVITNPAGSVSAKPTPDSPTVFAAGSVIVKLRVVLALSAMLAAPNVSAITGGATTAIDADAVPPVPPSLEETVPVLLFDAPAAVPVTFTEKLQELFTARLPLFKEIKFVAGVAVIVPAPQVPVSPLGVEIINPAGKVSVKLTPVSPMEFAAGFEAVKFSEEDPFSGMLAAPKATLIDGGAATAREAEAVLPLPPSVEVTLTLLLLLPAAVPVTFTLRVQEAPAASVPPERLIDEEAAVAVAVPVQVVVRALGVETTRPAGNESVKATPLRVRVLAGGFASVKLMLVLPSRGTLAAAKLSAMTGANAPAGVGDGLGLGVGVAVGVGVGVGLGPPPWLPPPPHAAMPTIKPHPNIVVQNLPIIEDPFQCKSHFRARDQPVSQPQVCRPSQPGSCFSPEADC